MFDKNKYMEIDKYQNLLNEVNIITSKYHKEAKASGERFNIFQILGMESKENKTHSAFLYALLNPNGNHLQGSIFLELFLKEIDCENWVDLNTVTIIVEKHIGFVDKDYQTGGRIDLVIEDQKGCAILIENKIYAYDQPNQLQRYYEYGSRSNRLFKVVYLTLDGIMPNFFTTGNLSLEKVEQIINISYRKNITEWLSKCAIEINGIPFLKESIIQYKNLIHIITLTTNEINMEQDIINLILNDENNYTNSIQIVLAVNKVKSIIYEKFKADVEKLNISQTRKINLNESYILFEVAEDTEDGFFISFRLFDYNNSQINASLEIYKPIWSLLYSKNPSFKHNHNYLGYVNHKFIRKFYDLPEIEVWKLNNDKYRLDIIQQIFDLGLEYFNALDELIKQNPTL